MRSHSLLVAVGMYLLCALSFVQGSVAFGQIWPSSQSDEAKVFLEWFSSSFSPAQEHKLFCGKMVLRYSNLDAFSNSETKARVLWFSNLEEGGYIVKDPNGFRGSFVGDVSYTFSPTDKLWALADRKEGDCFFYKVIAATNIKITQEAKHSRYRQVTVINATWRKELTPYEKVSSSISGLPTAPNRRGRFILMVDPYTQKYRVIAWDWGDLSGWWSGDYVPSALAILERVGPEALSR